MVSGVLTNNKGWTADRHESQPSSLGYDPNPSFPRYFLSRCDLLDW